MARENDQGATGGSGAAERSGAAAGGKGPEAARSKWTHSAHMKRLLARRYGGKTCESLVDADAETIERAAGGRTLYRGISITSGTGSREIEFVRRGLVAEFDLYCLSPTRRAAAQQSVCRYGLEDRVRCHALEDGWEFPACSGMDLVYWQDSLHYMLDVSAAVRWSRDVLISRGVFFMNEYVGPNRLQWSDRTLRLASRVLETLPKDYLRSEVTRTGYLSRRAHRMDAERIAAAEPTNCVDSERILDSVRAEFPDIEIQQLGGVVYYLALNGVMRNIQEEETLLMDLLMLLDEFAVEAGESVYATAVGRR